MYVLAPNQLVEKFPYSIGDLRKDNPQVSFPKNPSPQTLALFNIFPVLSTGPKYNPATQVATQKGCGYNAELARWETLWTVRDKTAEELQQDALLLQQRVADATQDRLDAFARTRNYDGIMSACTYATSGVPKFQIEGQYCVDARDATWASLYAILAGVLAGTRPVPGGYEDIEAELPVLAWPE